ncbi:MAG TPA: hypothetical protein VGP33_17880 [Chloroflexota bacterium]|jgi:hypothetical protein|nr:hypothetical protein [Chloroflexota bacterium]
MLATLLFGTTAPLALAQTTTTTPPPAAASAPTISNTTSVGCPNGGAPDVVLDIPNLSVDEVKIAVDSLTAHVNLNAQLGNLVVITAGVDANATKVNIDIKGVKAVVHLTVCLGTVQQIISRALDSVDRNPQILTSLLSSVSGLLSQTTNSLGQTVIRTVNATGDIIQSTLDAKTNVLSQQVVGNLLNLPVISKTTNTAGQTVEQVKDTSGAVIEVTLDSGGKIIGTHVVSQGTAS